MSQCLPAKTATKAMAEPTNPGLPKLAIKMEAVVVVCNEDGQPRNTTIKRGIIKQQQQHSFNGIWVSRHQKGKSFWILMVR